MFNSRLREHESSTPTSIAGRLTPATHEGLFFENNKLKTSKTTQNLSLLDVSDLAVSLEEIDASSTVNHTINNRSENGSVFYDQFLFFDSDDDEEISQNLRMRWSCVDQPRAVPFQAQSLRSENEMQRLKRRRDEFHPSTAVDIPEKKYRCRANSIKR